MEKIEIIYWTATGCTEMMAKALSRGIENKEVKANLNFVTEANLEDLVTADLIALGCPAQGTEELDETEFEPFFEKALPYIKDKKVFIFGSYGWGLGEYQAVWKKRLEAAGATVVLEPLAVFEIPTQKDMNEIYQQGERLAQLVKETKL